MEEIESVGSFDVPKKKRSRHGAPTAIAMAELPQPVGSSVTQDAKKARRHKKKARAAQKELVRGTMAERLREVKQKLEGSCIYCVLFQSVLSAKGHSISNCPHTGPNGWALGKHRIQGTSFGEAKQQKWCKLPTASGICYFCCWPFALHKENEGDAAPTCAGKDQVMPLCWLVLHGQESRRRLAEDLRLEDIGDPKDFLAWANDVAVGEKHIPELKPATAQINAYRVVLWAMYQWKPVLTER